MQSDRRAILTLVALGRISAAEAERLLLAWNSGRESLWMMAACLTVACLDACQALLDSSALSTGATQVIHHVLPMLTHLFGGIL